MAGNLILTVGTLSLDIKKFTDQKFPRVRINVPGVEYSGDSNPVKFGTAYEPKHQWDISCLLSPTETDTLMTMYDYFVLVKPEPVIYIDDYTRPVRESTQSRGLATGASATVLSNPSGWVEYFAKFKGFFIAEPVISHERGFNTVAITIQELDKTSV